MMFTMPILSNKPTVAIIGAGAAGLMAADYLSQFDVTIQVFEQKPSPARKLLMAGKSGLNISHAEPLDTFVSRYTPDDWLTPHLHALNAEHICKFMANLGIESFVGSTGRIFPSMMKASPLLRAWLNKLQAAKVHFFYRHSCQAITDNQATFRVTDQAPFSQKFDAIILATGGMSWSRLGSDGKWQAWLNDDELTPFYPSNVGICRAWSQHLTHDFGKAIKRVKASVVLPNGDVESGFGDIILSHYGMESGLIYRLNRAMREQLEHKGTMALTLDLLPDIRTEKLLASLTSPKKQSLSNLWRKAGLDPVKIALLREIVPKSDWHDAQTMSLAIKNLVIAFDGFRPIDEAISCGGGVKRQALNQDFSLKSNPSVFCCGEMLDWDAPTGGYLLTACFATGQAAAKGVAQYLDLCSQ
jgi:uncharacterized flavoprotein (TIGR03862 family)